MTYALRSLASFLKGHWRFKRTVSFYNHSQPISSLNVEGQAIFERIASNLLRYHEVVPRTDAWHLVGHSYQARLYRFNPEQACVATVCYENGESLYDLDLSFGYWEFKHHCGSDVYHGIYHIQEYEGFSVDWNVVGPKKAYTMKSFYKR